MRQWLSFQRENLFMWISILVIFGAATYFVMPFEPAIPFPLTLALCVLVIGVTLHHNATISLIAAFMFGFLYSAAYTNTIKTPQLTHKMPNADITGRVIGLDYTDTKTRIYINTKNLINAQDANIRISVPDKTTAPHLGDTIRTHVTLFPPSPADVPSGFDYAQWAYFNNLTATGFADDITVLEPAQNKSVGQLRDWLHRKSNSFLVDSLVLGYKRAVPSQHNQIWTTTGIGHVWSISGFHMTLVFGWLFALFYFPLRFIASLTRRIPAKIPAMLLAWPGLLLYLMLAGTDVATIRAFLMTSLIILAFVLGRPTITMRNVCIVMQIIFLSNPHCVMQAGFQLSFAAVFGLVWFWNDTALTPTNNKILKLFYGVIMTSLVATVFTAPFVAKHFGAMPLYGLIGNLILLPIFSFVIMPMVILGMVCAIFGSGAVLNITHRTYDATLWLAEHIASLPGAQITTGYISNTALALFTIALAAVAFIKTNPMERKRYENYIIGAIFATLGIIVVICTPRPIFYATADHELVAFSNNGKLEFNKSRASNHYFTFDTWRQRNGEAPSKTNRRRTCQNGVCIYNSAKFTVAYVQKFVPLAKNIEHLCTDNNIDYIVSYFDITAPKCDNKILRGPFVIYNSGRVQYVNTHRLWHRPHQ